MSETVHHADDLVTIHHGDCIEVMRTLPDCSVDAIVTDPPYGLGFMGREWDDLPPGEPWARECLRVLKPGGHLLAFGGTRTWHRLACAIEDAGFEIRDSIAWLHSQGFPKSLDVSKAIDKAAGAEREVIGEHPYPATPEAERWQGWGTALKPAFEPIVVARKPLAGTVAANVLAHGTGALNIDACRVEGGARPLRVADYKPTENSAYEGRMDGSLQGGSRSAGLTSQGRWPTNVVLDDSQAAELDRQSGESSSKSGGLPRTGYDDQGGASRFFPTFRYQAKAPKSERPRVNGVAHPTVKPLALMRWLVRLVTPPGGTVLEPFAGSGATVEACLIEGFQCIAIEREADYLPLIMQRVDRHR